MLLCHECRGTGRATTVTGTYLAGVPCRCCGGTGETTRRREGARAVVHETRPTARVRVSAHTGDRFVPPLVCVWHGDGDREVWNLDAELTADQAEDMARALLDAAAALRGQGGE